MTLASTLAHPHAPPALHKVDILAAAAALTAALLAATLLGTNPSAADGTQAATVRAMPVSLVAAIDTSVPAAASVFAGNQSPTEEPAPTF